MSLERVRRFVKTHERLLVIGGSFLAVFSLIFKEIVSEDVKEFKETLGSVRTESLLDRGFLSLHRELSYIPGIALREDVVPNDTQEDRARYFRLVSSVEGFEEEIQGAEKLLKVMEAKQSDAQNLDGMKHEVREIEHDTERAGTIADHTKRSKAYAEIENRAEDYEEEAFKWYGALLDDAEKEEAKRATRYKRVKILSYGLIVFGAVVGLLGRILDVKGLAAE